MLPQEFLERMENMLGEEYPAFLKSYDIARYQALRLNPQKGDDASFLNRMVFSLERVPWAEHGYYYTAQDTPGKHPYHEAGVYYIQEPSAMAPAAYLTRQMADGAGERILDLCAAPGGKSTQIAAAMAGRGILISNEIHPARAKILSENIERMGIANAVVTNETPQRLAEHFSEYFTRIMVDAPCSGEGMFRKNEEACEQWSTQNVELCADRQDEILDCAASMLAGGGRLVYSTCTFAPAEDEGSIGRFLERHPEFYVEEVPLAEGMSHGLGELSTTIRLWPHKLRGEGHYVAVLRKEGTLADGGSGLLKNGYENGITAGDSKSAAAGIPEYLAFAGETFVGDALEKYAGRECRYLKFGEQLYRIPEGMPSVKGLKVLRPGLHLGTAKKGRFEPSHALALTLHAADVLHTMDLPSDGREIRGYLNGETFPAQGEKGWYRLGKARGRNHEESLPEGTAKTASLIELSLWRKREDLTREKTLSIIEKGFARVLS